MQPSMPSMPSVAPSVSPPMIPFTGHPDTPLTSQQNGFPMPPFDPSAIMPFDFNPMWAMGFMPPPMMPPMCWPGTPSTIAGMDMVTPKTGDSGISSLDSSPTEESEVVKRVPGRLCLVNNHRLHDVSRDEILRRISYPEFMNSSTLAAFTRKAKTKDAGSQLRTELEHKGIKMPNNRKKGVPHTCFSPLPEEEAVLMANELTGIAHNTFPAAALAQQMTSMAAMCSPERMQQLHRDAFHAARFLKEVLQLSNQVNVPLCGRKVNPVNDPVHQGMYLFSALTHGFGIINHKTWLSVFSEMASQVAQQTACVAPST